MYIRTHERLGQAPTPSSVLTPPSHPFPNPNRELTPLLGQGARDPKFDRLAAKEEEREWAAIEMQRGVRNRGAVVQLSNDLARQARSWSDLQNLVRKHLYGSHIAGQQDAKLLINTAVNAYNGLHPGGEPFYIAFALEKEYDEKQFESRRQRVDQIAQQLERQENEEYKQFLQELEHIRNLLDLESRRRVMQVDPRSIHSTIFRASGAAQPIYDALKAVAPYVSIALDFIPIVGQVKGFAEAALGRDLITGQQLPMWARGLIGALSLLPFAKGAFGVVKAGIRVAGRAGSSGLLHLAALAYQLGGKVDPRTLFRVIKGLSEVSENSLRIASRIPAGRALTAGEKAAVAEVAKGLEAEASRLSRTASGVIEKGRALQRTESGTILPKPAGAPARAATKTFSKTAQGLVAKGYLPGAIQSLESLGVKVTQQLATQLGKLGDSGRDFLNLFHRSKGFQRVVSDLAKGGNKAEGAMFVMHYATKHPDILAKVRANPLLIAFEWGAGIKKTRRFGDIFAREVDIVVRGEQKLGLGETIYNELKNWTTKSLQAAKYNKKLAQQFVRDAAILDPKNIRWVFNSAKIGKKSEIIDVFVGVIRSDAYLMKIWGDDVTKIRTALERVIQLYP